MKKGFTYVPAVETCRTRGWGPGTFLRSAAWSCDRIIVNVDAKYVFLRRKNHSSGQTHAGSQERVLKLPEDVTEAVVVEVRDRTTSPVGYRNAVQMCLQNAWSPQTVLRSKTWGSDRILLEVETSYIMVGFKKKGRFARSPGRKKVLSLPEDTYALSEESTQSADTTAER